MTERFPRSNKYSPHWLVAGCSGGANPLWLTEWLTSEVDLHPGMRILDLGCGRALSSSAPYQYDAAGNMTHDDSHSYTYDAENRLIQVDNGATATYLYDAEGRRVQKTSGGATTCYIYDLSGKVMSEASASTWLNVYLRLGGKFFAQYTLGAPRTQFIHSDYLGSTRLVTSFVPGTPPTYALIDSIDYLPFGEQISGASSTSDKFTGKDTEARPGPVVQGR